MFPNFNETQVLNSKPLIFEDHRCGFRYVCTVNSQYMSVYFSSSVVSNVMCCIVFLRQYLASLGIQSLVQQGATQGKTAHKLMDALKDTDILHWKQSLSELIEISLAQTTSIWRMYGKRSGSPPRHRNTHLSVLLSVDRNAGTKALPRSLQIISNRGVSGVDKRVGQLNVLCTLQMFGSLKMGVRGNMFFMVSCLVSRSTMALQQAQLLLNMSSLEPVNFGVHQNNTEAFAVALCHLAELHAEQVTDLIFLYASVLCPAGGHSLGRFIIFSVVDVGDGH